MIFQSLCLIEQNIILKELLNQEGSIFISGEILLRPDLKELYKVFTIIEKTDVSFKLDDWWMSSKALLYAYH